MFGIGGIFTEIYRDVAFRAAPIGLDMTRRVRFRILDGGDIPVIEARADGVTHRLEMGENLRYSSPALIAHLDPHDLSLIEATAGEAAEEGQALSLTVCASMVVLLRSLESSMPHLPRAASTETPESGTRIGHPGYPE